MKKLLCSACLLGEPCRYDGKSKPIGRIDELRSKYILIPVCPEMLGGLMTPRLPCEIQENKVIRSDGKDVTKAYTRGAEATLSIANEENITFALLKEKSPSCGVHLRYDGSFRGELIPGKGITSSLLTENGIEVFSEDDLNHLL